MQINTLKEILFEGGEYKDKECSGNSSVVEAVIRKIGSDPYRVEKLRWLGINRTTKLVEILNFNNSRGITSKNLRTMAKLMGLVADIMDKEDGAG